MFLAEDKRGTGDFALINAAGGSEGLNETSFAGTERANEGDDGAIRKCRSECSAETVGIG